MTAGNGAAEDDVTAYVELANAMLLTARADETVSWPLGGARYEAALAGKIAASGVVKTKQGAAGNDFGKSFK